jgi:methylenetetrahydrofolate dehydrogenase (NADP+)/methenyltetrahydrofolate cyclohydrolase
MNTARIIDGRGVAARLRSGIAASVTNLKARGASPGLAVVMVGDNPASDIYVRNKSRACAAVGIRSFEHRLPAAAIQADVERLIHRLNADPDVHGILLQLPVPPHIGSSAMIELIAPEKDVDGLHPLNIGRLVAGLPGMVPCTPQGALLLIREARKDLAGLHAVVIGRSLLFGKPMAQLLLAENCTVTQAHSRTSDLPALCRQADILVAAIGRAEMVKGGWIKPGAIVIDVGINRMDDGTLKGDVDFAEAVQTASAISPVPGGVGPMTISCLLTNTVKAAETGLIVQAS